MNLHYLPINNVWAFCFGLTPTALDGWPMFFATKAEAIEAAFSLGLLVLPNGKVITTKD